MWISRDRYNDLLAQVQESEENAKATVAAVRGDVTKALEDAKRLNRERDGQTVAIVAKAEDRALAAESALTLERAENRRAERHWASMFLRREKSFPLPPTAEEKEEAKAEVEEARNQPLPLTEVQTAMRAANRIEAAKWGKSQEEADADFEREFLNQMVDAE